MSRKSKTGMTPVLFAQLYMESWKAGHTVRQFADRVGFTVARVHARVQHYRKKGLDFPSLKRSSQLGGKVPLPVDAMAAIISRAMEYRSPLPDSVRPAMSNGRR